MMPHFVMFYYLHALSLPLFFYPFVYVCFGVMMDAGNRTVKSKYFKHVPVWGVLSRFKYNFMSNQVCKSELCDIMILLL